MASGRSGVRSMDGREAPSAARRRRVCQHSRGMPLRDDRRFVECRAGGTARCAASHPTDVSVCRSGSAIHTAAAGLQRPVAAAAAGVVSATALSGNRAVGFRIRGATSRGAPLRAVLLRLPAIRTQGQRRLLHQEPRREGRSRVGIPWHGLRGVPRRRA